MEAVLVSTNATDLYKFKKSKLKSSGTSFSKGDPE
jgi:hypothetical protein